MRKRMMATLAVAAMLLVGVGVPAVTGASSGPTYSENWDGRGSDSLKCGLAGEGDRPDDGSGWIHWVFSTKGASTDALLTLGGTGSGSYSPGEPLTANIWHFYTPYAELDGLTAGIELFGGQPGAGGGLVISDYCPNTAQEHLTVAKTVDTSYERDHDWGISKGAESELGYVLPCGDGWPDPHAECPKVWLFADGTGDETVTWTVDVPYEGHVDSKHRVAGDIDIENTGNLDAVITGVEDLLAGTPVDVDCPVTFPHTLAVGSTLRCTYDEHVDSKITGDNVATAFTERNTDPGYSSVPVPIVWGDPDVERNETVTVDDCSDLVGCEELGQVTAPHSGQFTSSHVFRFADFDECGSYRYDNTATIRETGEDASARVKVNVQCVTFEGETAWAANGAVPGQLRYTNRGNWATYVQYGDTAKTTTLFAGRTLDAGQVSFSAPVDGKVTITVDLAGPWQFEDVAENLKVQDYAKAPSGNPAPGGFGHKVTCDAEGTTCEVVVPANNFYGVHLNVGQLVPDPNFGP